MSSLDIVAVQSYDYDDDGNRIPVTVYRFNGLTYPDYDSAEQAFLDLQNSNIALESTRTAVVVNGVLMTATDSTAQAPAAVASLITQPDIPAAIATPAPTPTNNALTNVVAAITSAITPEVTAQVQAAIAAASTYRNVISSAREATLPDLTLTMGNQLVTIQHGTAKIDGYIIRIDPNAPTFPAWSQAVSNALAANDVDAAFFFQFIAPSLNHPEDYDALTYTEGAPVKAYPPPTGDTSPTGYLADIGISFGGVATFPGGPSGNYYDGDVLKQILSVNHRAWNAYLPTVRDSDLNQFISRSLAPIGTALDEGGRELRWVDHVFGMQRVMIFVVVVVLTVITMGTDTAALGGAGAGTGEVTASEAASGAFTDTLLQGTETGALLAQGGTDIVVPLAEGGLVGTGSVLAESADAGGLSGSFTEQLLQGTETGTLLTQGGTDIVVPLAEGAGVVGTGTVLAESTGGGGGGGAILDALTAAVNTPTGQAIVGGVGTGVAGAVNHAINPGAASSHSTAATPTGFLAWLINLFNTIFGQPK